MNSSRAPRPAINPALMLACGCVLAISGGFALNAQSDVTPQDASQPATPTIAPDQLVAMPGGPSGAGDAGGDKKDEFPPFDSVVKELEKVVSTADGAPGFYTLYMKKKDGSLVAELPKDFEGKLLMIAPTVAGGDEQAGVMGGTIYGYWKRFDKNLVLMEPNFIVRSTGDTESQTSVKQLYTDRVILDTPIVAMGPGGGPVIDLKSLFVGQANRWFMPAFGGYGAAVYGLNPRLLTLEKAKSFPQNVEVTYRMPDARGQLVDLHYSVRNLPENPSYKPRVADTRVGYFNIYYNEMGKPESDEPYVRYITRWQLEKADPKLKISPPKQPIVWYIESTTPVRYRRWVREGILSWNKAFEACGFFNAMEVYQQDAGTGEHMDKDPEDCRYNFFRWNTSNQGYAIGPSREDPRTGQTLDADVVWHAGLTKAIMGMYKELSGQIATVSFTPETFAWLNENPQWDPRVRLAPAAQREEITKRLKAEFAMQNSVAYNGHDAGDHANHDDHSNCRIDGIANSRVHRKDSACHIGEYMAMNIGLYAAALQGGVSPAPATGGDTLDGLPEEFLGAMIRYVSAHEVGHCLGLQHNFSASTIRSLKDVNTAEYAGPTIGSVMEYAAVNINSFDGQPQGAFATPTIGPYDMWAIQFGYGAEEDRAKILARVGEPELIYHTNIDMIGPDPRVMTWDIGADAFEFGESRMKLVRDLRGKITTDLVKDGESWRKARERYYQLLDNQLSAVAAVSRWIGSSYVNRDFKGDPAKRPFIENVPADKQRQALAFVINNALKDDAFGLTPQLVQFMGIQLYPDGPGYAAAQSDPSFEVHDLVSGVQASALTMVINPTTLRRLYDNEFRTMGVEPNPLTLAEVMNTITDAVWADLKSPNEKFTASKPMASSFRRNLQREYVERLIDLSFTGDAASPAQRTIANLATLKLRQLSERIKPVIANPGNVDEYTMAHLTDAQARIGRALEAQYIYNR